MTKKCPCGKPRRKGGRNCRECHAASMRHWRRFNPDSGNDRQKTKAREIARSCVRRGLIEREPCEVCGDHAQIHHPDYSQPLLIVWLCSSHHREVHRILENRDL